MSVTYTIHHYPLKHKLAGQHFSNLMISCKFRKNLNHQNKTEKKSISTQTTTLTVSQLIIEVPEKYTGFYAYMWLINLNDPYHQLFHVIPGHAR